MRNLSSVAERAFILALAHGTAIQIKQASVRTGRFHLTDFYDVNGNIIRVDYSLRPFSTTYSTLRGADALAFKDRYGVKGFLSQLAPRPPNEKDTEADGFITVWAEGVQHGRV